MKNLLQVHCFWSLALCVVVMKCLVIMKRYSSHVRPGRAKCRKEYISPPTGIWNSIDECFKSTAIVTTVTFAIQSDVLFLHCFIYISGKNASPCIVFGL